MKQQQFPYLMSPGNIGKVEIRNRIVTSPMGGSYAGIDGSVTPRMVAFYAEKAKGGAGLVTVEYSYIDRLSSKSVPNQLGIYHDECNPGLAFLARAIHDWGAKCSVQICHAGANRFRLGPPIYGPSDELYDVSPLGPVPPIPITGLSREQIPTIIKAFVEAAGRVKRTGFDMVEIHCAHGYLLSQFSSPHHNKRTDEYGGSLENRMRLTLEVVRAVKKKVGADFPVTIRISAADYEPKEPITIDDSLIFAKKLEETGVDAIHVSGGTDVYVHKMITSMYQKRGFNLYLADAIKNRSGVKIPIMAGSCGITTPAFAEEILSQGKADFAALGRASLADPHWGRKLKAGAPEDVVPCIRCNVGCVGTFEEVDSKGIACSVNPRLGNEEIRTIAPLEKKKKVAIIGAGPGGMEAARLATIRGHNVTLYEKKELGGALIEAGWDPEVKPDVQFLLDYYRTQMKKLKIKVIRGEATADTIVNGGYDVAIVATGAVAQKLDIPGINKPHVYEALQVTGGKDKELGKTVVVVGGGEIGCEIALSQALKGKKVIMTTRRGSKRGEYELANDAPITTRMAMLESLKANNVEINLSLTLKEITDEGIISVDKNGSNREFKGDSIVLCAGFLPDDTLGNALRGKVKEVRPIGDCVEPRRIHHAIHEGWLAGNQI